MKIKKALFTAGYSSFYFDDQQAIKNGAGLSTPAIRSRLDLPLFVRRVNVFPYN